MLPVLQGFNLRIFATLRGVPSHNAIKNALDLVGLPYKDKKLFSQYSLGMKQRLAIALAIMHDNPFTPCYTLEIIFKAFFADIGF